MLQTKFCGDSIQFLQELHVSIAADILRIQFGVTNTNEQQPIELLK